MNQVSNAQPGASEADANAPGYITSWHIHALLAHTAKKNLPFVKCIALSIVPSGSYLEMGSFHPSLRGSLVEAEWTFIQ